MHKCAFGRTGIKSKVEVQKNSNFLLFWLPINKDKYTRHRSNRKTM